MFLGLTAETWSIVGSMATAAGTFVSAIALIAAFWGIRQNTSATKQSMRAMQVQFLESIFKDIRELDRQYIASFHSMSPQEKTAWSASFFNTIEYLCFVAKEGIIHDERLKTFIFQETLPAWKEMFEDHVRGGVLGNKPTSFCEFKAACRTLPQTSTKINPDDISR